MTTINCGICGKKLNITRNNAYEKIKDHLKGNKQDLTKIFGYYLSKKAIEYE